MFWLVQTSTSPSRTPTPRIESTSLDSPGASSMPEAMVLPTVSDSVKYNISDTSNTFPVQTDEPLTSNTGDICENSWPDDNDSSVLENTTCDENQSGWHFCLLLSTAYRFMLFFSFIIRGGHNTMSTVISRVSGEWNIMFQTANSESTENVGYVRLLCDQFINLVFTLPDITTCPRLLADSSTSRSWIRHLNHYTVKWNSKALSTEEAIQWTPCLRFDF